MALLEDVIDIERQKHNDTWAKLNTHSPVFLAINLIYRAIKLNKKNYRDIVFEKQKHIIEAAYQFKDAEIDDTAVRATVVSNHHAGTFQNIEQYQPVIDAEFDAFKGQLEFYKSLFSHEGEVETFDEAVRSEFKTAKNYMAAREKQINAIERYDAAKKQSKKGNIDLVSEKRIRDMHEKQTMQDVQRIFPEYKCDNNKTK